MNECGHNPKTCTEFTETENQFGLSTESTKDNFTESEDNFGLSTEVNGFRFTIASLRIGPFLKGPWPEPRCTVPLPSSNSP